MARFLMVVCGAFLSMSWPSHLGAEPSHDWYVAAFVGAVSVEDTSDIFSGTFNFSSTKVLGASTGLHIVQVSDDLAFGAEAIVARHIGEQDLWEIDAVVYLRWLTFPWSRNLRTSFAIGMGPSFSSKVPELERVRHGDDESARLTNFVFGELAFGLPSEPDIDLTVRYHHRSGIFGLVHNVGEASTTLAIGLKHRF